MQILSRNFIPYSVKVVVRGKIVIVQEEINKGEYE